jgi:hypothetical protein
LPDSHPTASRVARASNRPVPEGIELDHQMRDPPGLVVQPFAPLA